MANPPDSEDVTDLLAAWRAGDAEAEARLLDRAYVTLRHIAIAQLRAERPGHTLQPTALVHEAYLRLLGQREIDWRDRAHFYGLAALTMRRVLVDHARRRLAKKRKAGEVAPPLTVADDSGAAIDLLDLDRTLTRLAERFPRQARVVELRYFADLELDEIAALLEVSERTVKRDWRFARVWLREELGGPAP